MSVVNIGIPSYMQDEIKYCFNQLFSTILGLQVNYQMTGYDDYIINVNGVKVILGNVFFKKVNEHVNVKDLFPSNVQNVTVQFGQENFPIVSLYHKCKRLKKSVNSFQEIDIIGATYFILTRWEEKIAKERDNYNRFLSRQRVDYFQDFLDRPVINEYAEVLWTSLLYVGFKGVRQNRKHALQPSHDIDDPFKWWNRMDTWKSIIASLTKNNLYQAKTYWRQYHAKQDPWDTYDHLMDLSEIANTKSIFYFLMDHNGPNDRKRDMGDPRIKATIDRIKERGHHIGLHPSYLSQDEPERIIQEKEKLEELADMEITRSRQHYLRFKIPETWRALEEAGIKEDASMAYADCAGFRSGICQSYPLFDVEQRRQMDIWESPLIVMDASLIHYEGLDNEAAIAKIVRLKEQVKKYNGHFTFLWHNSSFHIDMYQGREEVLEALYA